MPTRQSCLDHHRVGHNLVNVAHDLDSYCNESAFHRIILSAKETYICSTTAKKLLTSVTSDDVITDGGGGVCV